MADSTMIAILAGGQSTRMGRDKAMLTMDGETLLARIAMAARATGRPAVVVGRTRPNDWAVDDVEFIPDTDMGLGPIGGLAAALGYRGSAVLMLACDMPRLSARSIAWLADAAEARRPEYGLAVSNDGQIEPLFSVYQPSLLPLALARIAEGRRSLHGLIEAAAFDSIEAPDDIRPDLVNVNTAEEWRQIGSRETPPARA